ncbi:hypothetical protein LCGC14_2118880 [marine sediment metagenome]|uniref:Uncharacterized protein n=1 Tax=marine sediment metagenome TaxID=412755 RepID=A0A0F9ERX9_9ZZZZ
MRRVGILLAVLGLLTAYAIGDRVVLKDGRVFEGKVTETDGKVLIDMAYGTISFLASDVQSIRRMPTPAELLEWQLSQVDRTDPDALYQAAEWAKDNDLPRQADELLREVIALDSDHSRGRRLLGYLKADGKWLKVPEALELAEGRLAAGKYHSLLAKLLPAIERLVDDAKTRLQAESLKARGRLRAKQFHAARLCFEGLAAKAPPMQAQRYAAIAKILAKHPDGMYVVTGSYPPTALLLGHAAPAVEPGPASLSRPEVLKAALRDYAKVALNRGRTLLDQAKQIERTEPEAAKARYDRAGKWFDTADAIVPRIARSYRVEVVRRRITAITRDVRVEAEKFDFLKGELGKRHLTPAAYKELLIRMLRSLNNIRSDLEAILRLAQSAPRRSSVASGPGRTQRG